MPRFFQIFVIVVVFSAVMMAMQGLYWYRVTQREKEARELARRLGTLHESDIQETLFKADRRVRSEDDGPVDVSGRVVAALEELLLLAGNPYSFQTLVGMMVGLSLAGMVLFIILTRNPVLGLLGLGLGYLPVLNVRMRADKRSDQLTEQLPDALDLMARSLQAGHGIGESMRSVAQEMKPPISAEFGRVYEENNLGRDFRASMNALGERNRGNFDVRIMVSSILLQRETGGNLVEILESISNTIRGRFVFKGKVAALTAEAKFSAFVLGGLPFAVSAAISAMRPEYLQPFFEDPLGKVMGYFIIGWYCMGVFVMRELTKVEV